MKEKRKYVIKDSGARQSFDTGAVRDIQAGKGRFELITPFMLAKVHEYMHRNKPHFTNNFQEMLTEAQARLVDFQIHGNVFQVAAFVSFIGAAIHCQELPNEAAPAEYLSPYAMKRLAELYEAGAKKYEVRNWEKGIPATRFLDSCMRHFNKARFGMTDEDHLAAALWNASGIIHFYSIRNAEMMDIPRY